MKYSLLLVALLSTSSLVAVDTVQDDGGYWRGDSAQPEEIIQDEEVLQEEETIAPIGEVLSPVLKAGKTMRVSVTGQGVAPMNTSSPAQAYALAKRAAIADGYRMIAEKVKGVHVDGQDLIKNMMIKRSTVRTSVNALVRNANVVETSFKEGLCEVEMEMVLSYSQFPQ